MKQVIVLAAALFIANHAEANTLKCWNIYEKFGSEPTFTATIISDNEISDMSIRKTNDEDSNNNNNEVEFEPGSVAGEVITSNHSPYKGNQRFDFKSGTLTIPAQLDNQTLITAQKTGIGMGAGENAVIIGNWKSGFDGGSHYSIRMRCRNYAK